MNRVLGTGIAETVMLFQYAEDILQRGFLEGTRIGIVGKERVRSPDNDTELALQRAEHFSQRGVAERQCVFRPCRFRPVRSGFQDQLARMLVIGYLFIGTCVQAFVGWADRIHPYASFYQSHFQEVFVLVSVDVERCAQYGDVDKACLYDELFALVALYVEIAFTRKLYTAVFPSEILLVSKRRMGVQLYFGPVG